MGLLPSNVPLPLPVLQDPGSDTVEESCQDAVGKRGTAGSYQGSIR